MKKVKYLPRHSGIVVDPFMTLPREACKGIEKLFAHETGIKPINHSMYLVEPDHNNAAETYITFTDYDVSFSHSFVKLKH